MENDRGPCVSPLSDFWPVGPLKKFLRLLKKNSILSLVNSYVVDSPQPSSLSYMWNFGSLLGLCLVTQMVTGVLAAMHYNASVDLAFVSVEHF